MRIGHDLRIRHDFRIGEEMSTGIMALTYERESNRRSEALLNADINGKRAKKSVDQLVMN